MTYGSRKRSHNRAFGSIVASRFYGGGSGAHKKPMHSRGKSGKSTAKRVSTKTYTKKKAPGIQNDSYGGGATSYQKVILGPKLKAPKGTAPVMVHSNSSVLQVCTTRQQAFVVPTASCGRASFQAWETILVNNLKASVGNAASTTILNLKVFIRYITQEHRIMNCSIRPCQIEIYDYKYRRNSPDLISTTLSNASSADNTGDLTTGSWQASVATLPGWQPQDSSVFNQYVKIIKRRKVWLQAGESHVHVINTQYNKSMNPGLTGTSTQVLAYAGFTFGCFIRVLGSLSSGTTSTGVDVGSTEIGVYTIERASLRGIQASLPQTQQYQGVNATTGTEEFVDEVAGQIYKAGVGFDIGATIL